MKKFLLLLAVLATGLLTAQNEVINNYKYVIVPRKFDFFKEADRFKLNTLTKMAFEHYGFKAYFDDEQLPAEVAMNRCNALYGNLDNASGMLSTTIYVVLKDCNGKEVFRSEKGKSKIKELQKAYYEATRAAINSLIDIKYNYVGDAAAAQYLASQGVILPAAQSPAVTTNTAVTTLVQPEVKPQQTVNENTLFAQPIANGYQLVDSTPKVVLKMYRTSQPDSYSANGEGKSGVVFKKGNDWFFEYYVDDKLVSEKLSIKF